MFDYIEGKIEELTPAYLVLNNNGIGYYINISLNTYSKLSADTTRKIFIHELIREDAHLLFGFSDMSERKIFELLISVSGVGANTARMMLSSMQPDEISTIISSGNAEALKNIKGIGIKTAQRIIVDLKDKFSDIGTAQKGGAVSFETGNKQDAVNALVMLGFSKAAVEKTVNQILISDNTLSVEEIIKQALKRL